MKNLLKKVGYKLSAVLALLILSQTAVWAENGRTDTASALTGMQVVAGVALLIVILVIPAFKRSRTIATK